ncbi:MAG TPA: hypothetical protein VEI74_09985 [Candidatus Methylomirabilis sp.]|nr:hypothetical protein [Candidatus Methylomirabilis sp.]
MSTPDGGARLTARERFYALVQYGPSAGIPALDIGREPLAE